MTITKQSTNKAHKINDFKAPGNDKLNIAAYKSAGDTSGTWNTHTSKENLDASVTYFKAESTKTAQEITNNADTYLATLFNDQQGGGSDLSATLVIQASDALLIYTVTDASVSNNDLAGTLDLMLTGVTNATTADLLLA